MLSTLLLSVATLTAAAPPYADGEALIRAMHDRYSATWYQTLTFVQTTTFPKQNRVETWYEAARIPGQLRIDIAPLDSGHTILFRADSLYVFGGGQLRRSRAFVHPLMVLGFDIYRDPAERTVAKLKQLGFDLSKIREDTWDGRPAYVVGAAAGDTTSRQFWVDRERLVFVRMVEPTPDGTPGVAETRFNRYQPLGKGWISVEVTFTVNGELQQKEEYADVRGDVPLPAGLFEPSPYMAVTKPQP
jgi:hypothetical protein